MSCYYKQNKPRSQHPTSQGKARKTGESDLCCFLCYPCPTSVRALHLMHNRSLLQYGLLCRSVVPDPQILVRFGLHTWPCSACLARRCACTMSRISARLSQQFRWGSKRCSMSKASDTAVHCAKIQVFSPPLTSPAPQRGACFSNLEGPRAIQVYKPVRAEALGCTQPVRLFLGRLGCTV